MLVFFCKYDIMFSTFYKFEGNNIMFDKNGKVDWLTIIPILFWLLCMGLSVGKMYQTGNEIHIIDWLEILNSNTFSTYISMVICMAYQFFSVDEKIKQEASGLSRKWIWLTIISTVVYGIIAIINACRYCLVTSVIMAGASIAYVIIFFKFMKLSK